jgi:hypothetical protein
MEIKTHTEFYNAWMENPKTIDRINLILKVMDVPNSNVKEIIRIDKDGNKCEPANIMPELAKLLRLIKTHQSLSTALVNYDKVIEEYNAWVREENRKKNLIELLD